jgi:hypothetical protein
MKLNLAMIAILFAFFTATSPAFAAWDDINAASSTTAASVIEETAQPVAQTSFAGTSGPASSGFDLSSLNSPMSNAITNVANESEQQPAYVANTTNTTGNQSVSSLPECRTHTLSIISGPVNANGLPPCTLDSFVYMSLTNNGKDVTNAIYGDEGRDGRPTMTNFLHINAGIANSSSADGLTTGQAQ